MMAVGLVLSFVGWLVGVFENETGGGHGWVFWGSTAAFLIGVVLMLASVATWLWRVMP